MLTKITQFIYECFHLKKVKHEGWRIIGAENPDSVAEHSFTATQIAYILGKMEGANPEKSAIIRLWHDIAETRIGDLHKLGSYYFQNKHAVENTIINDQLKNLDFGEDIKKYIQEYKEQNTPEGIIAKDADILEQAFQGSIYSQLGYKGAAEFVTNFEHRLSTESAKLLWKDMQDTDFYDWSRNKYFPKK